MVVAIRVNLQLDPGIDDSSAVVERAARAVVEDRGVEAGELSLTLLDDAGMATLNRDWMNRDGPTDVLAFALHEADAAPLGDIYLGVERAVVQAREADEPLRRELARLAVHGTLHVLGWDHPAEGREQSEMWRHQERIVNSLGLE
jgi:probable rRNA maturation factor